jgi:putative addiction module killer protein
VSVQLCWSLGLRGSGPIAFRNHDRAHGGGASITGKPQFAVFPMVYTAFPIGYTCAVYEIRQSDTFKAWLADLGDAKARARIMARLDRLALGNAGDAEPVGAGVSELKIDYGPGYRVYYKRTDRFVYLLLCGGTKATQVADIKRAIEMAKSLRR